MNEESEDITELSIQDVGGRLVWNYLPNQAAQFKGEFKVNFSTLIPGVYFLKATFSSGSFLVQKIIKNWSVYTTARLLTSSNFLVYK